MAVFDALPFMGNNFSSAEIERELDAILSSRVFEKSAALQRLLKFLVSHDLAGSVSSPTESDIAIEVLHRRRDFEPASDSIVRKTMARLRDKLSEYYAGEGRASRIRIIFERGSYRPIYPRREETHVAAPGSRAPRVLLLPLYPINFHDTHSFADGLWEDLMTGLAGGGHVPLIPPTTARYLREKTGDMREYRRITGADVILDGTVRQLSDSLLQITVTWVDGLTAVFDTYLQTRTGPNQTTEAVQELCEQITERLGTVYSEEIQGQIIARQAEDPEARSLYLRAKQLNRLGTAEGTRASLAFLQRALELQPQYAAAHALMADAHIFASIAGLAPPKAEMPVAIECAQRALRCAPRFAAAMVAKGGVQFAFEWDFPAAQKSLASARALDPACDSDHFWTEAVIAASDDAALAAARMEAHAENDNCSASTAYLASSYCYNAKHWKRAEFWARRSIEINPQYFRPYPFLAGACLEMGRITEALSFAETGRRLSGPNPYTSGMLGIVLARLGRTAEARAVLASHLESAQQHSSAMAQAVISAALGNKAQTYEGIARMIEGREPYAAWLHIFPFFQDLHGDSEFQRLLASRSPRAKAVES